MQAEDELFQVQSRLSNYVERLENAKAVAADITCRVDQLRALLAVESKLSERQRLDETVARLEGERRDYEAKLPGLDRLKAEYEFRLQHLPVARIRKANEHEARKANALGNAAPPRSVELR